MTQTGLSPRREKFFGLWLGLVLLFAGIRFLVFTSSPLFLHNHEELCIGAVAREFIAGPSFPVLDFQYDPYGGGSLIVGITAVPFFLLLGPKFFVLKTVALAWSLGSITIWMFLYRRLLGATGMSAACLFWVFAPLSYQQLSLMTWGNHRESTLLIGAALLLLLKAGGEEAVTGKLARYRGVTSPNRFKLFLCGLILGFSFYFTYSAAIGILTCLVLWLCLVRKGTFIRQAVALGCGMIVGVIPWLVFNITRGWTGLFLYNRSLAGHFGGEAFSHGPSKGLQFLLVELPFSMCPDLASLQPRRSWAAIMSGILIVSLAIFVVKLLRRGKGDRAEGSLTPALVLLVYFPLFFLAYTLGDFKIYPESAGIYAYRYLAPLLPFFALVFGAAAASWQRFRLVLVIPVCLLALGIGETWIRERPDLLDFMNYKGYAYRRLGIEITRGGVLEPEGALARTLAIENERDRRECLQGVALIRAKEKIEAVMEQEGGSEEVLIEAIASIRNLPPESRSAVHSAMADHLLIRSARQEITLSTKGALPETLIDLPPETRELYARAFAAGFAGRTACEEIKSSFQEIAASLALPSSGELWQGLGAACGILGWPEIRKGDPPDMCLASQEATAFYQGLGFADAARLASQPYGIPLGLHDIPRAYHEAYACGAAKRTKSILSEDPVFVRDLNTRIFMSAGMTYTVPE
ncbi:hypothetical protein ACFLU6_10780 [Acidobacteriota bacterium]